MLDDLPAGEEIDRQMDRLLRDASAYGVYPTPVDQILEAAQLREDAGYSLDAEDELVSALPARLRDAAKRGLGKIRGVLDRRVRVVHVSPTVTSDNRRRFIKMHEAAHHVIDHQAQLLYADDDEALSRAVQAMFEREANQGGAELLFQRHVFADDAKDLTVSIETIKILSAMFGASFRASIRRYCETHHRAVAWVTFSATPCNDGIVSWERLEYGGSPAWYARFGRPDWPRWMTSVSHPFVAELEGIRIGHATMRDNNFRSVEVRVEHLATPYNHFLLLWIPPKLSLPPRRVRIVTNDRHDAR